jgi:hypothetical protein
MSSVLPAFSRQPVSASDESGRLSMRESRPAQSVARQSARVAGGASGRRAVDSELTAATPRRPNRRAGMA